MKVFETFNVKFLSFLQSVYSSFKDDDLLGSELDRVTELMRDDKGTRVIHDEFQEDVDQKMIEAIKHKNEQEVFHGDISFIGRANIDELYHERMLDSEKKIFWKNFNIVCQFSSMVRCVDAAPAIAKLATSNKDKLQDPSQLLNEVFSGGELSQTISDIIKDPQCMKSILANAGNIMNAEEDSPFAGMMANFQNSLIKK